MGVVALKCTHNNCNPHLILCMSNCKNTSAILFIQFYFQYIGIHIFKKKFNELKKKSFNAM